MPQPGYLFKHLHLQNSLQGHLRILSPDIFIDPYLVVPGGGQPLFGFGDSVSESLIDDQFGIHAHILQALVQFIGIGSGYPPIKLPVLYQCGSGCVVDAGHRGRALIDLLVVPRSRFQVLAGKGMNVDAYVIGQTAGDPGATLTALKRFNYMASWRGLKKAGACDTVSVDWTLNSLMHIQNAGYTTCPSPSGSVIVPASAGLTEHENSLVREQ